jgi:hypothetical protein
MMAPTVAVRYQFLTPYSNFIRVGNRSRDNSVRISTNWTADVRFSLLHSVQGALFPPRRETDHSAQSTAEVKNGGAILPLSLFIA